MWKKMSALIFVFASILFFSPCAYSQSLEELNAPAVNPGEMSEQERAKLEDEKLQAAQPLNMEAVEQMVQSAGPAGQITPEDSRYTLGANDVIEITVMRHPEVSGQFPINAEGKIQYNFVGDVVVSGITKEDAAKVIADRLAEYIVNPEVTIKIIAYNSKVIYVFGEVGAPGKVFMRGDTITIREALVQSGLPQLTGVLKKSWLITPSESGKVEKKPVNVYALMYEVDLRQNLVMNPGDVLFIPPTTMTKVLRAVTPVTTPVGNVAGTARTVATPF